MNFVLLDVVICLSFIFFLVALLCACVQEVLAGLLNLRGKTLWEGVQTLLLAQPEAHSAGAAASADPGTRLADALLANPIIQGQVPDSFTLVDFFRWLRGSRRPKPETTNGKPSYLKAASFAMALSEALVKAYPGAVAAEHNVAAAIFNMPPGKLRDALTTLLAEAGNDQKRFLEAVETWFDDAMEHVTGWYKRRTQFMLFLVGLLTAAIFNIDSVRIMQHLWKEPTVRAAILTQAEQLVAAPVVPAPQAQTEQQRLSAAVKTINDAKTKLNALAPSLPIGWSFDALGAMKFDVTLDNVVSALLVLVGWLITGGAVCVGSPFWFDLMGKLVPLRGSPKSPPPKAPAQIQAIPIFQPENRLEASKNL